MRSVLDTNTVVSGLFWGGPSSLLLDAARAGKIELYTSPVLLTELARIVAQRKFIAGLKRVGASVDELIEGYAALAQLVRPASIAPTVLSDPSDDHVLACSLAAQADLIVSGDADLLNLKTYQGISIVGAAEALRRLEQRAPRA